MMNKLACSLMISVAAFCGCNNNADNTSMRNISYPYDVERVDVLRGKMISEGRKRITNGMAKHDVVKIMGDPDEVNHIHKTIKESGALIPTQTSFVYLQKRNKRNGSAAEKDEHLIRVIFENDKVIKVDQW